MGSARHELTLHNVLADPLIRAVMAADKVDPVKLEAMLRRIADQIASRRPRPVEANCCA